MSAILVIGATGGTGREVVVQGLAQGHRITAFVRDLARLPITHDRLRVVTGTLPEGGDALATAARGQDAVISALGVGAALQPHGLIARSMPVILAALAHAGVRRFIHTSAYGVGDTYRDTPLLPRLMIRVLLRHLYADKVAAETPLKASPLEWTIAYPVTLTNGAATGRYRVGERLALRGVPRIARADLAAFLLSQVGDRAYIRKGVLVA